MKAAGYPRSRTFLTGGFFTFVVAGFAFALTASNGLKASPPWFGWGHRKCYDDNYGPAIDEFEGTWYWLRSPEQEKRVISSYFNRTAGVFGTFPTCRISPTIVGKLHGQMANSPA
jgi:hypothetical protein